MLRSTLTVLFFSALTVHGQSDEARQFTHDILVKGDILSKELRDSLVHMNFSSLWTKTPEWLVYGFIGNDRQRMRVKLISVIGDRATVGTYRVYGKNKVNANICDFQGDLVITNIRRYNDTDNGLDEVYRDSSLQGRFVVCGTYRLLEDPTHQHSGILTGTFASYFYIDRGGIVRYDDIEDVADGYNNNQFVGEWSGYDGQSRKRCNWGDFRIPNSGDFDIGVGEFSPAPEYAAFGWKDISLTHEYGDVGDKARARERAEWWE